MSKKNRRKSHTPPRPPRTPERPDAASWWLEALLCGIYVFCVVLALCPWDAGGIPNGLYLDELASILDLRHLMDTGKDMWGRPFPLFFQSVSDYKNPVYLYAALPWVSVFGCTPAALRTLSVLMALAASLLFLLIARQYGWDRRLAILGALLFFLSPSLLAVKRLIFAVNALVLTLTLAWFLWVRALEKSSFWAYVIAGLAWGLFTYSYTGARLMSFLFTGFLLVASFLKGGPHRRGAMAACFAFAVALIPMAVYMLSSPESLTARFEKVSLVNHEGGMALLTRAPLNYLELLFSFLWFSGDPNIRHHFGPGGESYLAFLPLVAVGLWRAWVGRKDIKQAFLFYGFLVFPLPAVITTLPFHNLRTLHEILFLVLLAVQGAHTLLHVAAPSVRRITAPVSMILLSLALLQGIGLTTYYALEYRTRSNPFFTGGALDAVEWARKKAGNRSLKIHCSVFADDVGAVDRPHLQMVYAYDLRINLTYDDSWDIGGTHLYDGELSYPRGTWVLVLEPDLLSQENFWNKVPRHIRQMFRIDLGKEYRPILRKPAGLRGQKPEYAEFVLYEKIV